MRALVERMQSEARPLAIETREFIGDQRNASVRVDRSTTYGLGGVAIAVTGNGKVRIDKQPWGEREKAITHKLALAQPDVDAVFAAVVADDFARLVIPEHTGYPDEPSYTVELTNAIGQTRRASKFVRCECAGFQRIVAAVGAVVIKHLDAKLREQLTLG